MNRKRWIFAAGAFGLGLLYTGALSLAGVEIRLGGRDVALPVAVAIELAFAAFGFFLGRAAEARAAERREADRDRESAQRLAALQARLLHLEKLATVGQIASRIAHEVRNPLAIMRTTLQNLREAGSPDAGEVERTCRDVMGEIDRLSHVTTSLAALSRPVSPRLTEVGVGEILTRVEWLSRRLLDGRPVSLRVAPPTGDASAPSVRADPDLACQVLLGLVANAAEQAPGGSAIELGWDQSAEDVVLRVRDSGPGVPPDVRERIFDPFFTTRSQGTGLGLAVARDFATAQGGSLALEEVEGPGASFALHLPRA